jgi:hypothetical protein
VHHSQLHARDATRKHGIPATSPARTLLDLAATLPQRDLDRAVEQAQVQRQASLHSLNEQFKRYPRHRGTAALTKAIRTDPKLTDQARTTDARAHPGRPPADTGDERDGL